VSQGPASKNPDQGLLQRQRQRQCPLCLSRDEGQPPQPPSTSATVTATGSSSATRRSRPRPPAGATATSEARGTTDGCRGTAGRPPGEGRPVLFQRCPAPARATRRIRRKRLPEKRPQPPQGGEPERRRDERRTRRKAGAAEKQAQGLCWSHIEPRPRSNSCLLPRAFERGRCECAQESEARDRS
jgi:hypothetical protein